MPLRRMNFFKGFFTRAEDWQQGQEYHIKRRRLHNMTLHTPGVVSGLGVTLVDGGKKVKVAPGHAIALNGQEIMLESESQVDVFGVKAELLFLVLRNVETPVDSRQDVANPDYHGEAFIEEEGKVTFEVSQPPDDDSALVLAKIQLAPDATHVIEPSAPERPGLNEIDRRDVPTAGGKPARIGLRDFATKTEYASRRATIEARSEKEFGWKSIADERVFFLATVRVLEEQNGEVSWRFKTSRKANGEAWDALLIRNDQNRDVDVAYTVYRLLWGDEPMS